MRLPIEICVAPAPPLNAARTTLYGSYINEILGHAGLPFKFVPPEELTARLHEMHILVTVGEVALPDEARSAVERWVASGGAWIAVAGLCGLPDLLGVQPEPPPFQSWGGGAGSLGEGYLAKSGSGEDHAITAHVRVPLHFFGGVPVTVSDAEVIAETHDAHGRPTSRAGITCRRAGRGLCLFIAPDVTGAVVRIQQGVAVTRDGVPSPDGLGALSDGVLKSDDGSVLDWILDRQPVKGAPGLQGFLQPVADQWRELLVRSILWAGRELGVPLPLIWLYPRNLPAIAHLSHDTDGNNVEDAEALLGVLAETQVHSTWCVILPGYPPEIIDQIRAAGHELAMHFDAMTNPADWNETVFLRQWRDLCALIGRQPATNKNHYLRWEGDTEFFTWLRDKGIGLDQTKGASKTGEAGFNFGTCHPYRPVAPDGSSLDILELPTPTQDLEIFAPVALLTPLLSAVIRSHGVLHLLFHPAHIRKPGVADAIREAVRRANDAGMEWWTGEQIEQWHWLRRKVRWLECGGLTAPSRLSLGLPPMTDALTVLVPTDGEVRLDGQPAETETVERWGFLFKAVTIPSAGAEAPVNPGSDHLRRNIHLAALRKADGELSPVIEWGSHE